MNEAQVAAEWINRLWGTSGVVAFYPPDKEWVIFTPSGRRWTVDNAGLVEYAKAVGWESTERSSDTPQYGEMKDMRTWEPDDPLKKKHTDRLG